MPSIKLFFSTWLSFSFDVGQQGGIETGFPDVPAQFVALTLLTTITGDGCLPHLVEETGNGEFVNVIRLLAVVVGVKFLFNFCFVVISDDFVLLNFIVDIVDDVLVGLTSLNAFIAVDVFLDVVVPFLSVKVVVKDIVAANCC